MKKFKFLENIATADAAFEAYGETPSELFENAALALFETMADTKQVKPIFNFQFVLPKQNSLREATSNFNLEDLLHDFLSELVFLKDEQGMVFSKFKVKIKKLHATSLRPELRPRVYTLQASIWGEKISPERHKLKVDVKAITRHQFEIRKEKDKFIARVVLDI